MKVCFLINQLAPGGAPTLLLDIVRNTDSTTDIEYTVCFIEGDDTLVPAFETAGARVVDFEAEFKFDPRALARMARFFRREEFDVLHAHLPYSQTVGRVFGRLGGIDAVVSTQHSAPNNYHPITRLLERLTRPLDSRTVAVSKAVERLFTGESHAYEPGQTHQWCTIHNGLDTEEFGTEVRTAKTDSIRHEWGLGDGPILLNVGRYFPQKSQHTLIKAMSHVVKMRPDAQLLIVGWGELENELRSAVRERGLDDNVRVTGRVPTIHPYYRLADAFVLSSTRESFGIVLLEAMAAKLPVVATDVQGIPEVVDHGRTGLLVPPNDPERLAEAMVEALRTDEPLGENGYERAATEFDIRTTTASHIELYRELGGTAAGPSESRRD
ncbi:glycosyltransferase [Halococcus hamelinensis]|uniref:Glycosyltransferase n=1 Tax=Halococcus hamelinensis 100A6 TaxID=1132509 RepID=M0M9I5_9EURY|nr:glycosyltransferase [Halococcus hamelinensis]EMA41045.1 glycosyltransferase [Halococcus hamelinensis 100A6]